MLFVFLVSVAIAIGAFGASVEDSEPAPVSFDDTTAAGLAAEDRFALEERGLTVPKAQVFYSQYQFVVGYRGVEHAIDTFQQEGHTQQFGYPMMVYVSDFAETDVTLTEEGYLQTDGNPSWVQADSATFVVGSDARTPSGETAVPFSTDAAAADFVDAHGGERINWETLQTYSFDIDDATVVRDRVAHQQSDADVRVEALRTLTERPVSVVVGENLSDEKLTRLDQQHNILETAETIRAGIDAAPSNTTVLVTNGTYEEKPVVDRPLTLRGENAIIRGDGNDSVVNIEGDDVAITGFHITGIGENLDADESAHDTAEEDWDSGVEEGYGHGDAGIAAVEISNVYVSDVHVETPTNGVLLRDVDRSVVEQVTVDGADDWMDGFMGVMAMRSPTVIQDSTLVGGRDSIYLHRSHGTVIRNNTLADNRFGVHFMYTSDSVIADNLAWGQDSAGITIMTNPTRNAIVGNEVRHSRGGIVPGGSRSYVAENVVVGNGRGLSTGASNSLYERNVVYDNEIGIHASSLRPTNRVVDNDIVGNDVPASTSVGPLRLWTHDNTGNYWDGASVRPNQGTFSPTNPVEAVHQQVSGAAALSASPAAATLDAVRDTTPGMREGNIIDTAPHAEPVQPEILAELEDERRDRYTGGERHE